MQFAFKVRREQPCLWLADGQELVHTQQLNQLPLPGRPTGHKGPSCFKEILFMGSPSLTTNEAFGPKNEALGPKRRELDPKKRGNNLTLPGVTAPPAAAKRRRKSLTHCMPHLTQGKDHRLQGGPRARVGCVPRACSSLRIYISQPAQLEASTVQVISQQPEGKRGLQGVGSRSLVLVQAEEAPEKSDSGLRS